MSEAEVESRRPDRSRERSSQTVDALVREALAVASKRTDGGKGIDDEQVHAERLAYAATEARGGARPADLRRAVARRVSRMRAWRRWPACSPARRRPSWRAQIEPIADEFGIADERLNVDARKASTEVMIRGATADGVVAPSAAT